MSSEAGKPSASWRAVGFDLDGTLFDHQGAATAAVNQFVLGLGHEPTAALAAAWFEFETKHFETWRDGRITFTEQRRLRVRDFLSLLGMRAPDDTDAMDALFDRYLTAYQQSWRAFDEAEPLLRRLHAQGTRVGVLTNGNHAQQVAKLEATGLAALVDVICTSEEIGYPKPDPRAFEILAERLRVPISEMVFVGDNPGHDIDGARAVGMSAGLVDHSAEPPVGIEAALHAAREA